MTMQYRAFWETSHDYATSRNPKNFQSELADSEKTAKQLVEKHGSGYVEILDEGTVVRKLLKDDGEDWRAEQPTDKPSHMKIDLGEYE